jgi:Carboxypeptidase regulatory-like domain
VTVVAWAARVAAAVLAVGVVTSCSGGHRKRPPPPTTIAASTTTTATTVPDHAAVVLPTVPGRTTVAPVGVTPGPAAVNGTVVDDTGAPVAAATVALQRLVGSQIGTAQVTTAEDGTWNVQGILGGLYRIRAWRPPDLAQPTGVVVFLNATGGNHPIALTVQHFAATTVQTAVSPDPPILGLPADIVVQVTAASVGSDGVIHEAPQVGVLVSLTAGGQWSVGGNPDQATGSNGQVSWQVTCEALGPQALSVSVAGGAPAALTVSPCGPVPTTTTPPSSTTTTVKP